MIGPTPLPARAPDSHQHVSRGHRLCFRDQLPSRLYTQRDRSPLSFWPSYRLLATRTPGLTDPYRSSVVSSCNSCYNSFPFLSSRLPGPPPGARGPSNFAHCSYSRERSVELSAPPAPPPASFRFKVIAKWDNPAFQPWFKFVSDSSLYSTLWAIPASPSDETKLR